MKALSLSRPYGALVVFDEKGWETRPRRYSYLGTIAIHSSKGFPKQLLKLWPGGLDEVCRAPFFKEALFEIGYRSPEQIPVSGIIGLVDIVAYHRTEDIRESLPAKELAFGNYADKRWAYQLANPRPLILIPCGGKQGLWNVPEDVERQIREQISF